MMPDEPPDPRYPPPRPEGWATYHEPFYWWGPVTLTGPHRSLRSLSELVTAGTLPSNVAEMLTRLLWSRASVIVGARPSRAGKTTLLTAVLEHLPSSIQRVYLRGSYEPFDFLDDTALDPHATVLLANEISPHLPVYLWGPAVARFLKCREAGFAIAATAHVDTPEELAELLTAYPLRVPLADLAAFDLFVSLRFSNEDHRHPGEPHGGHVRTLRGVWTLERSPPGGLRMAPLVHHVAGGIWTIDQEEIERLLARLDVDIGERAPWS